MKQDEDMFPCVADNATGLGLRARDLTPDEAGQAHPGRGGMSVVSCIDGLRHRVAKRKFPPTLVPERLGKRIPGAIGQNNLRVFRIGSGRFERGVLTKSVALEVDIDDHGTVQPCSVMHITAFKAAIVSTRHMWCDGECDE
ncbi:MAG: hypothetical protein ACK52I_16030 [Pseudomonadota bacterium]|jgi:hypothetical protein